MVEKKRFDLNSYKEARRKLVKQDKEYPFFQENVSLGTAARLWELSGGHPDKIHPKTQLAFLALQSHVSDPNVETRGINEVVDDLIGQATAGGLVTRPEDIELTPSQVDAAFDQHRVRRGGGGTRWGAILNYIGRGEIVLEKRLQRVIQDVNRNIYLSGGVEKLYRRMSEMEELGEDTE